MPAEKPVEFRQLSVAVRQFYTCIPSFIAKIKLQCCVFRVVLHFRRTRPPIGWRRLARPAATEALADTFRQVISQLFIL